MSHFDKVYNRLPDGRRIWLIQANEAVWHWNSMLDEKPYRCDWGGDTWIKGNSSRSRILNEVEDEDIAFCYQAAPDKKLLGVARFSRGGYQRNRGPVRDRGLVFGLDWWMRVPPLAYDVIISPMEARYTSMPTKRASLPSMERHWKSGFSANRHLQRNERGRVGGRTKIHSQGSATSCSNRERRFCRR
jgi:hypothetical protein